MDSHRISELYESLGELLRRYSRQKCMAVNNLFSDDLGFLLQGCRALQVSVLPWKEARDWKDRPARGQKTAIDPADGVHTIKESLINLPPSWQNNHSPGDTVDKLEERAFTLMAGFLRDLSRYQLPLPQSRAKGQRGPLNRVLNP